ncbi:hypothetical protein [Pseudomonas amygdali]|uniref:Putative site-specific DNA methyltransferase n=1 Tax=Pseudomonas amygdali pv. lachrymans TaxID=53707 RepID=A0A0P9STS4_PSEAV|nr:hypothetical protein [Pseudomonas amygdali]KPX64552.1 putative site-specific DNA methyltransferase [Pseudomonas amygdali pv. lachrymans]KPY79355.1 putative site-specific DNA methyltransferase [Pseudomonas amygdali pv. tabaci]
MEPPTEYELHPGDCLEVMRSLPVDSVDSVVTDPPYQKLGDQNVEARAAYRASPPSHTEAREPKRGLQFSKPYALYSGARVQGYDGAYLLLAP